MKWKEVDLPHRVPKSLPSSRMVYTGAPTVRSEQPQPTLEGQTETVGR